MSDATRAPETTSPAAAALARHPTSAISDALDIVGVCGVVWGPVQMSGTGTVAGPAYTVRFEPVEEGQAGPAADYIDDVPPGALVVIDNADRRCTVWGDILTAVALRRGVVGTVIDGLCRDVDAIRKSGYPLWARGAFMRTGKNRVRLGAVQVPITIGGEDGQVAVRPGDLVCADGNGVVVVPSHLVNEVAERAARVAAMEERVAREATAGTMLRQARARHGYHRAARPVR